MAKKILLILIIFCLFGCNNKKIDQIQKKVEDLEDNIQYQRSVLWILKGCLINNGLINEVDDTNGTHEIYNNTPPYHFKYKDERLEVLLDYLGLELKLKETKAIPMQIIKKR